MTIDITFTAVVPYTTDKRVRTIGIDPRVLSHPSGGQFIVRQMTLMMEELESECDAAMASAGVTLGDDGMKE